ncbi:VOC family protein [Streptomyces hainanensis]|uniref:VOC family protein n=1 Tax=Streptomyces hainanensis TaxID=402648 RepID=A0A4R4SL38_9ACTN|nr:VOC family protein [Streptomyces hainanensis]TDC62273.1 VOC family protein [Streptomyces hainanensis]
MTAYPEGAPCWADVTLPDLEAGKRFYGELFGWTFETGTQEHGGYTQAYSDDKAVGALAPQMPGQNDVPPAWTVYFESPDVSATADRVARHGGETLMGPMEVDPFGSLLIARDPAGVLFGVWQEGTHHGFGKHDEPNSFCWAEVHTRDAARTDEFFTSVFPLDAKLMEGSPEMDYAVWMIHGQPRAGRYLIPKDAPAELGPHTETYFSVADCDEAVANLQRLDGRLIRGPMDSPYGRFAAVADPQGATFALIDTSTTTGEPPGTV